MMEIMPALGQIEGVYHVSIEGGSSQQILVNLDPRLLNNAGLSISGVAAALSTQVYVSIAELENTAVSPDALIKGGFGLPFLYVIQPDV